ncbi:hypothetical protein JYU14_03370 [Simkania negevensis]|uniref:PilZ domain-containing protein n=1 Tax=Simkania negevensis TaxID=83561 RepID=A0ABS3ASG3_9BACT|nr:hypothetical protein [Simkania negevensis]
MSVASHAFIAQKIPPGLLFERGTNPALVYIIAIIIVLLILAGLAYLLWRYYRWSKFNRMCEGLGLRGNEVRHIRRFVKIFNIDDPLKVFMERYEFDQFSQRIAHYNEYEESTIDRILHHSAIIGSIRQKLCLTHTFKTKTMTNSRSLPKNYPITISYWDKRAEQEYIFNTKIISNEEFFLIAELSTDEVIATSLSTLEKAPIEVSFLRRKDAEYSFPSRIAVRKELLKERLYFRHSDQIERYPLPPIININGTILCSDGDEEEEETYEYPIVIRSLTTTDCKFVAKGMAKPLRKGDPIVLSFSLEGEEISCQTTIKQSMSKPDNFVIVATTFDTLSPEIKALFLRFMVAHKKHAAPQESVAEEGSEEEEENKEEEYHEENEEGQQP